MNTPVCKDLAACVGISIDTSAIALRAGAIFYIFQLVCLSPYWRIKPQEMETLGRRATVQVAEETISERRKTMVAHDYVLQV